MFFKREGGGQVTERFLRKRKGVNYDRNGRHLGAT